MFYAWSELQFFEGKLENDMKIITHFATVSTLALVTTLGVASMEQSGFVSVAWAQDDHAGDDGHESEGGQGQGSQGAGGQGQGGDRKSVV